MDYFQWHSLLFAAWQKVLDDQTFTKQSWRRKQDKIKKGKAIPSGKIESSKPKVIPFGLAF